MIFCSNDTSCIGFPAWLSELVAVSACMLNTQSCYGVHQIMVPIPKYPLYSAAISLFGGTLVPYYLSEEANWQLDFTDLQKSILAARRGGITVRSSTATLFLPLWFYQPWLALHETISSLVRSLM
jgi:hypothetical protein